MSTAARVRVMLADDHSLVRAGVRRILEAEPGIAVVGEVADGVAALEALERQPTDVLVLDLSMPGMDGFELIQRAHAAYPELKLIVLSMHASPEYISRAIECGADGYLFKDSAVADLVAAIHTVRENRVYYGAEVQRALAELVRGREATPRPTDVLSAREVEVLRLVALGLSTKEIASRLDISSRTVETHRGNLMRKLGVHSVALLTQLAMKEGLIGPST
jgi:DNA-binding NarL/FixJ family response regulator